MNRVFFVFGISLLLFSCAPSFEKIQPKLKTHPEKGKYLKVKFLPSPDFLCGATSLAMLFSYYGKEVSIDEISEKYFSPQAGGMFTLDLIACSREYGFEPEAGSGSLEQLKQRLKENKPVIVLFNYLPEPSPTRHFALVVGYYQENDKCWLILHSGKTPNQLLPASKFLRLWKRGDYWMMSLKSPKDKG